MTTSPKISLPRRLTAEFLGTLLLVTAVVGSGIMAERLAGGNAALALLANTIATGAALVALILTFGPISGAHLNPAVTIADALEKGIAWREASAIYLGSDYRRRDGNTHRTPHVRSSAHFTFIPRSQRPCSDFQRVRSHVRFAVCDLGLLTSPFQYSFPFAVGSYIVAAYWFTASTSFANPAVAIARSISDTFSGIRPIDVPFFVLAQIGVSIGRDIPFPMVGSWLKSAGRRT